MELSHPATPSALSLLPNEAGTASDLPLLYRVYVQNSIGKESVLCSKIMRQLDREQHKQLPRQTHRKRSCLDDEDEFKIALDLHMKNPRSLYRSIRRIARRGQLREAIRSVEYLHQHDVHVDITTFSALIAVCTSLKSLADARKVGALIRMNDLEDNEFLRTRLVKMYASCGSTEEARSIFADLPANHVHGWNHLLRGIAISGDAPAEEAMVSFRNMMRSGVGIIQYSFLCMIKKFAGKSAFTEGTQTHALLVKNGLIADEILMTSLINMYFKCDEIEPAKKMMGEMDKRNVYAWCAMIAGFTHKKMPREAMLCLRRMIREGIGLNRVVVIAVLPAIGDAGARKLGQQLHGFALKTISENVRIWTGLIYAYSRCGDTESARKVFFSSTRKNVFSWTALVNCYASGGRLRQALRSVVWMQMEGVKPNLVTIAVLVPVCTALKELRIGKELHCFVLKNGFLPNIPLLVSMMAMYSKCGVLEYSRRLFDQTEKKNTIVWTAMIDSCIENQRLDDAIDLIRSMQVTHGRLNVVAGGRMVYACGLRRFVKLGKEIHCQILKRNFEANPFVSAELIRMYGRCGEIKKARSVFDVFSEKETLASDAMFEAYRDQNANRIEASRQMGS